MATFERDSGDVSRPEGDGPVTLSDRTEPGGSGSPGANQGKTEPMSPTPSHPETLAAPDLADMSPGAADPQAPSHPDAAPLSPPGSVGGGAVGEQPMGLGGPGETPEVAVAAGTRGRAAAETATSSTPPGADPASGTAHHAAGLQGTAPEGESVETDTEAGAVQMDGSPPDSAAGHGDTGPAPAAGDAASLGTSETQPVVQGVRLPEE